MTWIFTRTLQKVGARNGAAGIWGLSFSSSSYCPCSRFSKCDASHGLCGHDDFNKRLNEPWITEAWAGKICNKLPCWFPPVNGNCAIARAMACDPPLLVADEPTGNLDTRSADTIIQLFETFVSQGKTIVLVTHDPSITSRTHRNIIISDGELIDETISRALPLLRHRHMLEFTKLVEQRVYRPHETIIPRDQHVDYFFMIRKGEVEVILQEKKGRPDGSSLAHRVEGKDHIVSRLGENEFFGEMELLRGGKSIANVRAGNQPVEALALPRADFIRVMNESPITAEALGKIMQKRLEEHQIADYRRR